MSDPRQSRGIAPHCALLLLSLLLSNLALAQGLSAGFGRSHITPAIPDSWVDSNGNAVFDEDIDTWRDDNGNGRFDKVYMAGFQRNRPAAGVQDALMAVALVLDDGKTRIALVAVDVIGLMRRFTGELEAALPPELAIDHLIVHATHNHEGPDTQGLWGAGEFSSGVAPAYMQWLRERILAAISAAIAALEPAQMHHATLADPHTLAATKDTRPPRIIDPHLSVLAFTRTDGSCIGMVVNYGLHPELSWDQNLALTADFPGYVRRGIESGIHYEGQQRMPGVGGTALWLTGNIGGLMTSRPRDLVYDRFLQRGISGGSHEKARAFGYGIAAAVLDAFRAGHFSRATTTPISVDRRRVALSLDNTPLLLAAILGLLETDYSLSLWPPGGTLHTEVGLLRIGPAWILNIPGELYPEIAVGGILNPPGADFSGAPIEQPSLRSLMHGEVNLMVNLANDAIGYIIPYSQWDDSAPWLYGASSETYGEVVSVGPQTAPSIYRALRDMLLAAEPASN